MSKIVIIGGTGFAGSRIAAKAAKRGHEVVSVSRHAPAVKVDGVTYVEGSALDADVRQSVYAGADVVVGAVSPRGAMAGQVRGLYLEIAKETAEKGVRFVIVGGFSSLRPAVGAQRFFESGAVPAEYLNEAVEMAGIFDTLKAESDEASRWVFISPAGEFGAHVQLDDTGAYRIGGDVALFDQNGVSRISGGDFALGVVDEIENPTHDHENIAFVW